MWCVKGTEESTSRVDSLVPLTHHDPRYLGLIRLVKKRKIHFQILSDLRIQLKDVAMLAVGQLLFLICHTFVCTFFFPLTACRRLSTQANLQTNVSKIRKINWKSSSQATSFKLGECNLQPSILTLRFRNCVKFNFGRRYLLSDSHTNTVISDRFAYPSRWRRKP